ncbi:MAG: T9SS type A sorting domain-containing protein [Lewinellaceae bacterium]|nr:T9SS type A sorting domain-containing protein [Phaeodactylibacter sp.]MCB9040384.1 T9SS type A sorting domain-containing protein [Lewinellaceae bacterium]
MKEQVILLIFFLVSIHSNGQAWQKLSSGLDYNPARMYVDTLNAEVYISGRFQYAGGDEVNGITKWNGSSFESLGGGVDYCIRSCPAVVGVTKFQEDIYCSPTGFSIGGFEPKGLARWDGEGWSAVGTGLTFFSGADGIASEFIPTDSVLYIFGNFHVAGQDTANSVAVWDGSELQSLGFPYIYLSNNFVNIHTAIFYENVLYVGGNFSSAPGIEGTLDFAAYDGNAWFSPARIKGPNDDIGALAVYNGEIYLGGNFRVSSGNAGNAIMKLTNGTLVDVGGSFDSELANVSELIVYQGNLYAFGLFNSVGGGIPAKNMARWDGEKWCGFNFDFDGRVSIAGVLEDQLYIGGNFRRIDGDTFNYVALWEGALIPDTCGEVFVNVSSGLTAKLGFQLFPNPATHTLHLQINSVQAENAVLTIHNPAGQLQYLQQLKLSPQLQQHQVDVSTWPPGVYFLRLQAGARQVARRFVKTGTG